MLTTLMHIIYLIIEQCGPKQSFIVTSHNMKTGQIFLSFVF